MEKGVALELLCRFLFTKALARPLFPYPYLNLIPKKEDLKKAKVSYQPESSLFIEIGLFFW